MSEVTIELIVKDKNGEVIGRRESSSIEVIEQAIADIPVWIEKYDETIKEEESHLTPLPF